MDTALGNRDRLLYKMLQSRTNLLSENREEVGRRLNFSTEKPKKQPLPLSDDMSTYFCTSITLIIPST